MARVSVYVPDELMTSVRERCPDLVVSAVLQEGLRARLECRHEAAVCAACAVPLDLHQVRTDAIRSVAREVLWRLDGLMRSRTGGTVEGAGRIVVDEVERHGAGRIQAPRLNRAARARIAEAPPVEPTPLPQAADSRRRHPTARKELTA